MVWNNNWLQQPALLQDVVKILQTYQIEAYLVGGAVRDILLGREQIVDLDFALPGDGLTIARRVANTLQAAFYPLDAERGTGRVVLGSGSQQAYLDFATLRGATLLADLAERDFTINAMALSLGTEPQLIDPFGGQRDLAQQQVQATSPTAFQHDPVRVLRAVRQAIELGFVIEHQTEQYLRAAAPALPQVSAERRRDELLKLLNTPAPANAVQKLRELGLLPYSVPEIEPMVGVTQGAPHYLDVFDHTRAALAAWVEMQKQGWPDVPSPLRSEVGQFLGRELAGNLSQQQLMPLAILLHDSGKPESRALEEGKIRFIGHEQASATLARQVLRRFRFSSQATDFAIKVVLHHMRPLLLAHEGHLSRRAVYRFFRDTGGAGVATALHALADHSATYPPGAGAVEGERLRQVVSQLLQAYFKQREQVIDPPPLLTGHDLIELLGLAEGRLIGVLLGRLKEAQAMGEVQDRPAALAFVQADPAFLQEKM